MRDMLRRRAGAYLARYPRIFFCHVPKCAGVSLSQAVFAAVYPAAFRAARLGAHIDLRGSAAAAELLGIDQMTAREVQLVTQLNDPLTVFTTGHCAVRPALAAAHCGRWHFVTILRDPVERFLSEYVYNRYKASDWKREDATFEAYLDSENAAWNAVTYARYFSGRATPQAVAADPDGAVRDALANLARFSVLGTVEDMPAWQAAFAARFGRRPRVARRNESPNRDAVAEIRADGAAMARVRALCAVDRAIHDALPVAGR